MLMLLKPTSLVSLAGSNSRARLSCLLEDDQGNLKGLSVSHLKSGAPPISFANQKGVSDLIVKIENKPVGILDPHLSEWDPTQSKFAAERSSSLSGAALTFAFTVNANAASGTEFGEITPILAGRDEYVDRSVRVLGEDVVGTIADELRYLSWGEWNIYPLLVLRRSERDLRRPRTIRSGGMTVTTDGSLIGVIIALFDNDQAYAIVPMQDILGWHRLKLRSGIHSDHERSPQEEEIEYHSEGKGFAQEPNERLRALVEA
jgi:hypothetical protein